MSPPIHTVMFDFSDPAPTAAVETKQRPRLKVTSDGKRLNIKGISKSLVLSELFNALPHARSILPKPYRTIDQAWEHIRKNGYKVDEWDGHELHLDLKGENVDVTRYDEIVGRTGAALQAIEDALVLINILPWDRKAHDVQLGWEQSLVAGKT